MEYMSAREISKVLGLSVQLLHYKTKTESFPEPDYFIGKNKMWSKKMVTDYLMVQKKDIEKKIEKVAKCND